MLLEELFDYKNQLMQDLVTNPRIVGLLRDSETPIANPKSLIYSQVFPYEYVPNTIEHSQTFVCCDVDIQRSVNKTYLLPVLYIWIFSHKSKLRLPEGGVRIDKLASEIAKAINGSRYYGIGELELYSSRRFAPISDYQGKMLTFNMKEFNRPSPSGKYAPSNRRVG